MLRECTTPLRYPLTGDNDTFYRLLSQRAEFFPDDVAAEYKTDDDATEWTAVSAAEMLQAVRETAKGLIALGVDRGDAVLIWAATRYQWGVLDFACSAVGAVVVPVYETDSPAQVKRIVDLTKPAIAFVDTPERGQTVDRVCQELKAGTAEREAARDAAGAADPFAPALSPLVFNVLDDGLEAVASHGRGVPDEELDARIAMVKADDLATIVFTSGSTGAPKGVELTYRNFIHVVRAGWEVLPAMCSASGRLLLFLPLAHCFGRYTQYLAIGSRGTLAYVPTAEHLLVDFRTFRPTYIFGVPRVYEKIYNAASQKAGAGFRGRLFARAGRHFADWSKTEQAGGKHGFSQRVLHRFYEKTVGSAVRSATGGSLQWLGCGGAPMNTDLAHFFNGLDGVTFVQGYGLTETAAPCCVNFEDANRVGSVGKPGPGIAFRVADDGELQIHGPCVFVGYYHDPAATRDAFTADGWLKTGDLASIDDDGFVYITGRRKNLLVTAGGKNVAPEPAEDAIAACPIVSHALVVGDRKPFVSAVVTLDPGMLRVWCAAHGLDPGMTCEEAGRNGAVRGCIQEYVDQANAAVSRAESVRKFAVRPSDFSLDEGTLTPSLKIVRAKAIAACQDIIEGELYAPDPRARASAPKTAAVADAIGRDVRVLGENFGKDNARRSER